MIRLNPDSIRADVIVSAKTSDKNYLIQMGSEDFRFLCDVAAAALDLSITELLLSIHGFGPP